MDDKQFEELRKEILTEELSGRLIRSLSEKRIPMSYLMFSFCKKHESAFKTHLLSYIENNCLINCEDKNDEQI